MTRVGFIGAGNMGGAILAAISGHLPELQLFACDVNQDRLLQLKNEYGVVPVSSISELADRAECIFLSVKPQSLSDVFEELKGKVASDTLFVSIAAGISEENISNALGFSAKVVLVMPNTPLLLGEGASALARGSLVSESEFAFVKQIFSCTGVAEEVPADKMKEIIAVNGSSPAFLYEIAKIFTDYAAENGIDRQAALRLFAQSMIGSAKMLTESGRSIEELIDMVSSKGGTTIAGLSAMRQQNLEQALLAGCDACTKRAYELAK